MLIGNVVSDVFLEKKIGKCFNLYIRKRVTNVLMLVGTLYEEWHAIQMRRYFRTMYGLGPNEISKDDFMYQTPLREQRIMEKVHQLNLKSHNKMVRQHEALNKNLAGAILDKIQNPSDRAARILYNLDKGK